MNSIINILDKATAELIAAGEVVERPSSVVKELVENSIDAGAKKILVEIKNGGTTYIRVTDNGCGISREDVKKAFLRHATSKIKTGDDLNAIYSLGFRGEALASISMVSRVELLTKRPQDEIGTLYKIEGGEEVFIDDAGCPDGTTFVINDLFYNVPARMKFLKRDVSEGNNVADIVERLALSHPEISFRMLRDGKETLFTSGDGDLLSAIRGVLGKVFATRLLPVDYEREGIRVSGYISSPFDSRKSRSMQIFFVNGRYVKSATASAGITKAYENCMASGRYPACVLNIDFPAECSDVNVHPAKTEIRFIDERPIFEAIYFGAKGVIERSNVRPELTINQGIGRSHPFMKAESPLEVKKKLEQQKLTFVPKEDEKFNKEFEGTPDQKPTADTPKRTTEERENLGKYAVEEPLPEYNPHAASEMKRDDTFPEQTEERIDKIRNTPIDEYYKNSRQKVEFELRESQKENVKPTSFVDIDIVVDEDVKSENIPEKEKNTRLTSSDMVATNCDQGTDISPVFNKKIPQTNETVNNERQSEEENSIEKVIPPIKVVGELFNTYVMVEVGEKVLLIDKHAAHERILYERLLETRGDEPAQYILPLQISLTKAEHALMLENADTLSKMGIEVEDFGGGNLVVRSVPMLSEPTDVKSIVEEIAESLSEGCYLPDDANKKRIFHSIACRAAVKAGDEVSEKDILTLARAIISDNSLKTCPHGRPVAIWITKYQLEKQFGRIG